MTSFTDLSSKEHFIHNCVDLATKVEHFTSKDCVSNLVKVEDQVQLTDVVKVFVQHLHKVVDGLKMGDSEQIKNIFVVPFTSR